MAYRLKNRQHAVPNGLTALDPATNFRPRQWADFEEQCRGWQNARIGNPGLTKRYRKSTDLDEIRDEVDLQLGQMLHDAGMHDFVNEVNQRGAGAQAADRPFQSLAANARRLAVGVSILVEWIKSKEEAVPQDQSNARAVICSNCPKNVSVSDWTNIFTIPAAAAIRRALQTRDEWKLATTSDALLGVCDACSCPLKLKAHAPIKFITDKMPKEDFDQLAPECWIRGESK